MTSRPTPSLSQLIDEIRRRGNPKALDGMSRYGINVTNAFGTSMPQLRDMARKIGRNHQLALQLWNTGVHDARILASMVDNPSKVSLSQMEGWVAEFDSWDIVDGTCGNLFDKTPYAVRMAKEWSSRDEEYVKRASFVLMAELAVHDKQAANGTFLSFLPLIIRESSDERNFVKKAVNWALRQIGKRNAILNGAAIRTCERIQKIDSKSARWIASDALRELTSESVQKKFKDAKKGKS